jgi:hypothetical protein
VGTEVFSTNGAGTTRLPHAKQYAGPLLHTTQTILKWTKDLKTQAKNIELLEENKNKSSGSLVWQRIVRYNTKSLSNKWGKRQAGLHKRASKDTIKKVSWALVAHTCNPSY